MLTNKQFDEFKQELPAIIGIYKKEYSEQKPTNYQTYEKQWANRLRTALKEIKTIINQAKQSIKVRPKLFGRLQKHRPNKKSSFCLPKTLPSLAAEKWPICLRCFHSLTT